MSLAFSAPATLTSLRGSICGPLSRCCVGKRREHTHTAFAQLQGPRHATHAVAAPERASPPGVVEPPLKRATPLDKGGQPQRTAPSHESIVASFRTFFSCMPGKWDSQRTYHYRTPPHNHEESSTTFDVCVLSAAGIDAVLASNASATNSLAAWQRESTHGFRVSFRTRMASQERLIMAHTNLAFVPDCVRDDSTICGDYYRDLGYEEKAPVKARFVFDAAKMKLTMTTWYTKVVSVDEIALVNPQLRIRNIVNYARPAHGAPLSEVVLVGFGVEALSESGAESA